MQDAAVTLAITASNNKSLAKALCQNVKMPALKFEELSKRGIPTPMLALTEANKQQLFDNVELLDKLYHRSCTMHSQRLFLAFDHTYLLKAMQQAEISGARGLLGGPWLPSDDSRAFLDLAALPDDFRKMLKAKLMLEIICWDPSGKSQRVTSLAAMPMTLSMGAGSGSGTMRNGNWAARL